MYAGPEALVPKSGRLALIGDTQETALVERLFGLEQNAPHQPRLLAELGARRPDGVLHVGDLVTFGTNPLDWRKFDAMFAALRADGVPLMPVVGNHDRMFVPGLGVGQLRRRFAVMAERTWYRFRYGALECVALDSNLGARESETQAQWLRTRLAEADAAPEVRGVIGFWHHPPYSNSTLVRPSRIAREQLLPEFAASRKAVAIFTGHCHAYEHFREQGIELFVSGGGGGPRHTLHTRVDKVRSRDLYDGGALRFLHFLLLAVGERSLTVEVVRLNPGDFDVADTIVIPWRSS